MGRCFMRGEGTAKDADLACTHFQISADKGNMIAMQNLGVDARGEGWALSGFKLASLASGEQTVCICLQTKILHFGYSNSRPNWGTVWQ
jgi:TPR repeat protein